MFCLPIKGKTIEDMTEKINMLVNEYYYGYTVHQISFNRPTEDCEWYSCLILLTKDDE